MKKLYTLFVLLLFVSIPTTAFAQDEITPPGKGKAVVYIIQTRAPILKNNLRYFDGETYLGQFNGKKAFRYECDLGKHLFWIKSRNYDFIETEFKADAIYLIEVKLLRDLITTPSNAYILPVNFSDERQVNRIFRIMKRKGLTDLNTYEIQQEKDKIYETETVIVTEEYIQKGLEKIQQKKERGKKVKKITPEMEYIKQ